MLNSDIENNKLECDQYYLSLRRDDLEEKDIKKYIRKCERIIRSSPEYMEWVKYIHEVLNLTNCQISGESSTQVTTEIHHHPITLYDLIEGIIYKRIEEQSSFCSFDIATEAIELHYQLRAPFVLLVKSLHEKYHNGFLKIPNNLIKGDPQYFISMYGPFLESKKVETIKGRLKIDTKNCGWVPKNYDWNNALNNDEIELCQDDQHIV